MATSHHHRTSSNSKRPSTAHARPSRPALSKRIPSYKSQLLGAPRKEEEEDDLMAASFLNFCTVCEKQIIVPNNSILYCSESCRRKDNTKPITFDYSPPQTPFNQFSSDDLPIHHVLTPRSPTSLPSKRLSYGFSETSEDEAQEWTDEKQKESEAARYLRSFPRTSTDSTSSRPSRPNYKRSSTSNAVPTHSTTPSLSHTPTSSISMSMPYTPNNRPLPSRTNPHTTSYGTRSIDLVNPFAVALQTAPSSLSQWPLKSMPSCQTSTGIAEGEMELFEKKSAVSSPGQGSLKQLFAFSAMQAPPTSTASTMRSFLS